MSEPTDERYEIHDHWVPSPSGHQLYVKELAPSVSAVDQPAQAAILFFHGVFSNSRFFYNPDKRVGTASFFAERGYRVFLGEFRGHGRSRSPQDRKQRWDWSFDSYAREDVPDLVRFAANAHAGRGKLFAFCHSMSGYAVLAGLGCEPALQDSLAGVILTASAVNDYTDGGLKKRVLIPLSSAIARVVGRLPGKRFGLGPSDEPYAVMKQFAEWAGHGRFQSVDGKLDYWSALAEVTLPVLAGVGAADVFHASPARARKLIDALGSRDKTLEVYGKDQGFTRDFGHFDIAAGRHASQEILPRVDNWMKQR